MPTDPSYAQPAASDQLIERCLQGDQQAWEAVVRQHWRKVFNVAYKFVGKHDEAEDLTQDIFFKIFKSLQTFDRRANFQTWLISVSRNLCIDHYRSVRKERETIDRDVDPGDLSPTSHEVSPYVALEQRDRVVLLREAMQHLPATLRTAVLLRDIQELSYHEIATAARLAGGHGQIAHQPRPLRTRTADPAAARGVRCSRGAAPWPRRRDETTRRME
jgi:RNA polymerase sigma-70 factor, ECF subfamily